MVSKVKSMDFVTWNKETPSNLLH